MRIHGYSLLKAIYRTAVTRKLVEESPVDVEGATARATPKDVTLLTGMLREHLLGELEAARHEERVVLAVEVVEERPEGDACTIADLIHRDGVQTVAQHELQRRVGKALPGFAPGWRDEPRTDPWPEFHKNAPF
jgi:hypothetical protein